MGAAENDAMAHLAITGHRRPENEYSFSLTLNYKSVAVSASHGVSLIVAFETVPMFI